MNKFIKLIERKLRVRRVFKQMFLDLHGRPTADGMIALRDLADFCYANKPCPKVNPKSGIIDPIAMGIAEGRREVYLKICDYLNVDERTVTRLLTQAYEQQEQQE